MRKTFRRSIPFEKIAGKLNQQNIKRSGISLDISDGGLGFNTDVSLEKGEIVKLLIPASKARITVPVFSEVIWARPANDHFRTGLRFLQ